MKTIAALILSCAAFCWAQEPQPDQQEPQTQTQNVKRLQSVNWDLSTHKLVWVVEKGSVVNGEFVPATKVKYEVSPDEAFMAFAGEKRTFGEDEADALHHLLDVLSLYCVESTVWWDHGETGTDPDSPVTAPSMVTKPEPPATKKPAATPDSRIVKVGKQQPAPAPNGQILVAAIGQ